MATFPDTHLLLHVFFLTHLYLLGDISSCVFKWDSMDIQDDWLRVLAHGWHGARAHVLLSVKQFFPLLLPTSLWPCWLYYRYGTFYKANKLKGNGPEPDSEYLPQLNPPHPSSHHFCRAPPMPQLCIIQTLVIWPIKQLCGVNKVLFS